MANTLTGLFQTLVLPATAQLAQPLALKNSMITKVYYQEQPISGTVGQVINVNIPVVAENDAIDIGNGAIQISDGDHTNVAMTVNNNLSIARRIPDFDKVRTPIDFKTFYLQPMIESLTRKVNRQVCALVTSTNFSSYTSITGGDNLFTRANLASAWANLMGAGVPATPGDLHFVTSHIPYATMLGDATQNFIQQYVVGESAAVAAQQTARFMNQFQADMDYDQLMPLPTSTSYAGLFFNKNAIAFVPVAPPPENKPNVMETTYSPEGSGLVYRVQFWYDPREQAWIIHINCVFALTVVRPNFGSYLVTT
jgi:hypothetical protein